MGIEFGHDGIDTRWIRKNEANEQYRDRSTYQSDDDELDYETVRKELDEVLRIIDDINPDEEKDYSLEDMLDDDDSIQNETKKPRF